MFPMTFPIDIWLTFLVPNLVYDAAAAVEEESVIRSINDLLLVALNLMHHLAG